MNICRSKVVSVYDYRNIDLRKYAPPFAMEPGELRERLNKLRIRHGEMRSADFVLQDDFVTVDMNSELTKYQKSDLALRVGRGLLNPELEQAIIGMRAGDKKTFSLPEGQVEVKIVAVRRRVLPELTDEVVRTWNIDGVDTVNALLDQITAEAKEQYVQDMAEAVTVALSEEVDANSEFILDPDEVRTVEAEGQRLAEDMLRSAGLDPNTADDDAVQAVSGRTKQEHFDFLRSLSLSGLKSACIGACMMAEDGAVISDSDYQKALSLCAESMGITREDAEKNILPYDKFLRQAAADYQFEKLENHVKLYLTEEEEK